jgi:adenylate cyclase
VVLAGVCAALGWAALVAYALLQTGGMDVVTRDFVHYLTDNRVLIGAEIDKIVSILTVTAILAVVIARGRALLERSVAEGAAAYELSRFFSPEIAARITGAEVQVRIGEGQARDAAVLFTDIRGFTGFANAVAPDALMATLADYQARMVPLIQAQGGTIDKFMGDGIMATFGAAAPSAAYAADALRAVDAIMGEAGAWAAQREADGLPALRVGAACASGRVIFGAVGEETRLEFTVIGDAVNLAAKLEKHTKAEGVRALTDAATYAAACRQGYAPPADHEHRPACTVEGLDVPVDVVVLAG